jgi:hypothetical protein
VKFGGVCAIDSSWSSKLIVSNWITKYWLNRG